MSKISTVSTNMGPFDEERFGKLLVAYERNLKEALPQFDFEGHEWARNYAYYMLEYLAPALGFGQYTGPGSIDLEQFS